MLRIDRRNKTLKRLAQRTLQEAGLLERFDMQKMIRESPEAFFEEMDEQLLLLGEEVKPSDFVSDRIDLLAVDKQGTVVVLELKRGNDKYQLLQALAYASMLTKWEADQFVSERARLVHKSADEAREEIEQYLEVELSDFNSGQRVILLAEAFDFSVLSTVEWLHKEYEVDTRCYRLSVSADPDSEFLTCTCIYPAPELRQHAAPRRRGGLSPRWATWEEALAGIESQVVKDFLSAQVRLGNEHSLNGPCIIYRLGGKRRWFATAHKKHLYIWQEGRFLGDDEFWKEKVGADTVRPVKKGQCLSFTIETADQIKAFEKAVKEDLASVEFGSPDQQEGERANP